MRSTTKYSRKAGFTHQTRLVTEQPEEHDIQIFTDGSKSEYGVGAGIAIFIQSKLAHQIRYTQHKRYSNNQAEKLAIFKALETIGTLHFNDKIPRSATVHTEIRITLQSIQNINNNNYLIEEIRKSAIALEKSNWTIKFTWIKAHVGIYGNELADKLAKEATRKADISFNRIPKNEIIHQLKDQSIAK
jgi:ribonuclease HI